MSWVPPNTAPLCQQTNDVTTCSSSAMLFLLFITDLLKYSPDDSVPRNEPSDSEKFDFIIVGAGSAGCVIANRLSEISSWRVLLLEAGPEEPTVADVPAFQSFLPGSSIDWNYRTEIQKYACKAYPNGCPTPRGKVMGGSSTINSMVYIRGSPADYDGWSELGNTGWSFDEVLPYFLKSEDNRDSDILEKNPGYHSQGGYLTVQNIPYQDENMRTLIEAWKEIGFPEIDQNGEQQIGIQLRQSTFRDGERLSTNRAFIRPIREERKNLTVRTECEVTKVLINPETKQAYGVQYMKNGELYTALAEKEVILSAGAYNSPKLLMVSGVGPKDHLTNLNITVIKDIPVGQNLQDHPAGNGLFFALDQTAISAEYHKKMKDMYTFLQSREGPLTSIGFIRIGAVSKTRYANETDAPDLHCTFYSSFPDDTSGVPEPLVYYTHINARPIVLTPRSRGHVELDPIDPVYGNPIIHQNFFSAYPDIDVMVEGYKLLASLNDTEAMRSIGARIVETPLEYCTDYAFGTDEYWRCVATYYTGTIYHPVGTCKMGPKEDKTAVIDPKLQVYGIKGLRVIDAAMMPTIVSGNTNAPVIMIAEKGADLIKERWLDELIN